MISFKEFIESHVPIFMQWLKEPHVSPFWQETENPAELTEKYIHDFPKRHVWPFIITFNNEEIGYIQFYDAFKVGNGWWEDEAPGTFGIDLLLGNSDFTGKGLAPKIIKEFVSFIRKIKPEITNVIIDPDPGNQRAIKAFQKAGFIIESEVITPGGKALLMRMKI